MESKDTFEKIHKIPKIKAKEVGRKPMAKHRPTGTALAGGSVRACVPSSEQVETVSSNHLSTFPVRYKWSVHTAC